jgi:hypothetical protein
MPVPGPERAGFTAPGMAAQPPLSSSFSSATLLGGIR